MLLDLFFSNHDILAWPELPSQSSRRLLVEIMEATDIKNQIQTAVEEIDDLKNKRAEVSFVKTAEDLEEGGVGGLDLVLYLSIKLRKTEDFSNIPDSLKINTSITLNKLGRIWFADFKFWFCREQS